MNTIQIKRHFETKEFLKSKTIPKGHELSNIHRIKINWWIDILSPIRDMLDFPITVTDGLRIGSGTSQHYFNGDGAVDIRPSDEENSEQFIQLGLVLAANPHITRVCYYTPSPRFTYGGFHCDRKFMGKHLRINEGEAINWQRVEEVAFISRVKGHSVDIKAV